MPGKAPIELFLEADLRGQEAVDRRDAIKFRIEDDLINAPGAALLGLSEGDFALLRTLQEQAKAAGREVCTPSLLVTRAVFALYQKHVLVSGHDGLYQRLLRFEKCGLISGLARV